MRLRRLELAVIALTLAFICFMGGYFTGRKGAVNIVTVAPQQSKLQHAADMVELPSADASNKPGTGNTEITGTKVGAADSDSIVGNEDTAVTGGTISSAEAKQPQEIAGAPVSGDGRININLASQSELMDLPGIGSVIASRIVDYRRQHGNFSKIEDLRNVSGIGEKRYEAIQEQITVGN